MEYAIEVHDLYKSYKQLKVLEGIDFSVKKGSIMALLGPNGAGKTTTVRILCTLLSPDSGRALVNGYDVVRQPSLVRGSLGLTGQFAAVDEYLTGEENLKMIGRLYRLDHAHISRRTLELLRQFDLEDAAGRQVKTYSGGMKRRIDLAMSLIASPPVIFLDEPTTGLDPRSRIVMWDIIKKLVAQGTTILLTTQYMEEADQLADRIVVIDHGNVIADGTADMLKSKVGSDRLELTISKETSFDEACRVLQSESLKADPERRTISFTTAGGVKRLKNVLQQLESSQVEVENVSLQRPTLDDVFLSLTGHTATDDGTKTDRNESGKNS